MVMNGNRLEKGSYGYYEQKRNREILKTVLMFAVSFSLFFAGFNLTGQKANLLTVVAVLGMLPSAKSAVSMIMYLRYHGCSRSLYETLQGTFGDFEDMIHAYGLVFTTYQVTYEAPSVVVKNGNVCGLCKREEKELGKLGKHIAGILSKNGLKANVKIFSKEDTYLTRMKQLKSLPSEEKNQDKEIMDVLHQISL